MVTILNANKMADVVRRIRRVRLLNEELVVDRRVFRDRRNPLEMLSRGEIRERYRFFPETVVYICQLVQLDRATGRSNPLPDLLTTLVALHFYATNCHHIVTADLHGISRASVSRAIHEFTSKLGSLAGQFVHMRTDRHNCQMEFFNVARFPNIVGLIDGTQIRIQAPNENEEDYVNRKGFHSINVQMICDATFRILDVVAKWPGSVHDSRILRESEISARLERGEIEGLLLGDSGYPCKKYLMTPYHAPQTIVQGRFNDALCRTRVIIEQTFGIIKRRFPCLKYGLRVSPVRACRIIMACAVLHNIGMERNDCFSRDVETDEQPPDVQPYLGAETGSHFREYIANAFFN